MSRSPGLVVTVEGMTVLNFELKSENSIRAHVLFIVQVCQWSAALCKLDPLCFSCDSRQTGVDGRQFLRRAGISW